jgi:hypothetical protein
MPDACPAAVTYYSWVGTDVKTVRKKSTEERNLGTAKLSLTTNIKVEFASRASKREVTFLRQGEKRNTRKVIEQSRRGEIEKQQNQQSDIVW